MRFHQIWLCMILIMCKHIISGSKEMPLKFEYVLAKHPEMIIGEFGCANTDYLCCTLQCINSKVFDGKVKFCIKARDISDVALYTADFKPLIQGKRILDMLKTFADTWSTAKTKYSVQIRDASNVKQLGLLTRGTTYYEINDFACKKFTPRSKYDKITDLEVIWTDVEDCMNENFFTRTYPGKNSEELNMCLKNMENGFHTFKPTNKDKLKLKEYWTIMTETMKTCDVYDSKDPSRVRFRKQKFPEQLSSCIIAQPLYVDGIDVKSIIAEKISSCTHMKYSGKYENTSRLLESSVSELRWLYDYIYTTLDSEMNKPVTYQAIKKTFSTHGKARDSGKKDSIHVDQIVEVVEMIEHDSRIRGRLRDDSWISISKLDDCSYNFFQSVVFYTGEKVKFRNEGGNWKEGTITNLTPLKVKQDGWNNSYEWDKVRKLNSNFAIGDKVKMKNNVENEWYNGIVRSTDPLEVSIGDDDHGFVWDQVKSIN